MKSTERTQNQNGEKGAEKQEENLTIKRISKISNYGIFKSFVWKKNTKLPPFRRYNLFYGWNGTGKSTLAKMFAHLEEAKRTESDEEQNNNLQISFDNVEAEITLLPKGESGVDQTKKFSVKFNTRCSERSKLPQVKVFNKDFVKKNIFTEDGAKGIVAIGEDRIKKQKELLLNEKKKNDLVENISQKDQELKEEKEKLSSFFKEKASYLRAVLKIGETQKYDSNHFKDGCESMLNESRENIKEYELDGAVESKYIELIKKGIQKKEAIEELKFKFLDGSSEEKVSINFVDIKSTAKSVQILCKEKVSQNITLAKLQGSDVNEVAEIANAPWREDHVEWAVDAYKLYKEELNKSNSCMFCTQKLPKGFIEKVSRYIEALKRKNEILVKTITRDKASGNEENLYSKIDNFSFSLNEIKRNLRAINSEGAAAAIKFVEKNKEAFEVKLEEFGAACEKVSFFLSQLEECLENKKNFPDKDTYVGIEKVTKIENILSENKNMLTELNEIIGQSNKSIKNENKATEKNLTEIKNKVRKHTIANSLDGYKEYKENIKNLDEKISSFAGQKETLTAVINKLNEEVYSLKPFAEKMNGDLAAYFGRKEFTFKVEKNGYQINRNGVPIDSDLSEGEKTAVAFTYFLQTLSEDSFSLENGVVVIDDPISSLDDNALYSAFSLMKSKTSEAKQLFVLTHNFNFFKMVQKWYGHENKQVEKKIVAYYMLESRIKEKTESVDGETNKSTNELAIRASSIKPLAPLLKNYLSEYHYLFSLVYNFVEPKKKNAANEYIFSESLDQQYFLPNVARKVMEIFFAFQFPEKRGMTSGDSSVYTILKDINCSDEEKTSVLVFLNEGSHANSIDHHLPKSLVEMRSIFSSVLGIIKIENPRHYKSMVKLATPKQPAKKQSTMKTPEIDQVIVKRKNT